MDNNVFNTKMDELLNFGSFEALEKEIEKISLQIEDIEKRKDAAGDINERLVKVTEELELQTAFLIARKIKFSDLRIYELSKEFSELTNLQKEIETLQPIKGKLNILKKAKELWEEKIKKENSLEDSLKEVEEALQKAQKELYDLGNRVLRKEFDFANLDRMFELQTSIIPSLEEKYQNLKDNRGRNEIDGILPQDVKELVKQYMLTVVLKTKRKDVAKIQLISNDEVYKELFIKIGDTLDIISEPVMDEDYEFECWLSNGEPYDFSKPITEDMILEARFREKPKTISVKFGGVNNGKGANLAEVFLVQGELVEKPEDPVLDENHEFECWLLNGEPFDFTKPITEDIVLEAKYKEKEKVMVSVKFDANNNTKGPNLTEVFLVQGEIVEKPEDPVSDENREFEYWMLDGQPYDFSKPVTKDIVLEAKYKEKIKTMVSVKFIEKDDENGLDLSEMFVASGVIMKKPEDPVLDENHEFECWMLGDEPYDFSKPVTKDIVLKAKYREKVQETTQQFEVKFDLNGGFHDECLYEAITLKEGELLVRPEFDPSLDDQHEFECWMHGDEPYDFTKPVDKDMILKAKYNLRTEKKTVTFKNKRGKVIKTVEVSAGETIPAKEMPKPKHKMLKLSSWVSGEKTIDTTTVITKDIEVVASYKKDWKKIAAVSAGVAVGFISKGVDTALFNTPGVFSGISVGVNLVASRITTKKLKNHKPVDTERVAKLKWIKKANAKVVNYFRDEKNIRDLRTFFRTAAVSSGISLASEILIENNSTPADSTFTGRADEPVEEVNVIDYFETNDPEYIFDTASDAANNIDPEASAELFEGSIPVRAYNPENELWITLDENMSIEDVKQMLGTDNPLFDFQKNGVSTGWVDLENSYNLGGLGR